MQSLRCGTKSQQISRRGLFLKTSILGPPIAQKDLGFLGRSLLLLLLRCADEQQSLRCKSRRKERMAETDSAFRAYAYLFLFSSHSQFRFLCILSTHPCLTHPPLLTSSTTSLLFVLFCFSLHCSSSSHGLQNSSCGARNPKFGSLKTR